MTMTEQQAIEPRQELEIVDRAPAAPATRPAPADHTGGALDRAAEAALMPGAPGRDEFLTLASTARILSLSGAAPKAVRGNPYIAFHVALVGRDLGISPSAALELIDVIDSSSGPQLSLSPQLLNGQIRRLGLGEIIKKITTAERCVAVAVGPGGIDRRCRLTWRGDVHADGCGCDILGESEFTWADAQMAGLAMPDCTPGAHTPKCRNYQSKGYEKCNQGYVTYPKRMLWWRASGYAADDYFPEAGLGLYSAEELGAAVDGDGRPIDPATVELPDGYQPALPPPPEQANPDDIATLQLRIAALPEDARASLRERWTNHEKLSGRKPVHLNAVGLRLAQALVSGVESQAKTASNGDWNPAAALEAQRSLAGDAFLTGTRLLGLAVQQVNETPTRTTPPPQGATQPGSEAQPDPEPAPEAPSAPTAAHPAAATLRPAEQISVELEHATSDRPAPPILGEAAPEPTAADIEGASPADVEDVIGLVTAMKAHDVDKELTRLRLHTEGELPDRRRRLSIAMLRERTQQIQSRGPQASDGSAL